MYLGNIQFDQVEEKLGYKLTDKDKETWAEFHSQDANLKGKESCFHVYDIPRCIIFKGDGAKEAILKMFTPDKITKSMGTFQVYEDKE
jgi:hypothetical protein